jgi:hypothetical protein
MLLRVRITTLLFQQTCIKLWFAFGVLVDLAVLVVVILVNMLAGVMAVVTLKALLM